VDQRAAVKLAILLLLASCGDNRLAPDAAPGDVRPAPDAPPDAMPDAPSLTPPTLAGTGLCLDPAGTTFSPDVHEDVPRFPLWADTATKRRWIYLPPGTAIDTSDMNHWRFPMGTKLWKEFTRDGVRVETRYIVKIGPGDDVTDWFYVPYQWNASEDDTTAVPMGVMNANGTAHDIPSRAQCLLCHERLAPSRILGFQAIQLDGATPIGIDQLAALGLLSSPPAGTSPHFPLPGTATTQAALGYMHANCGHCHNPASDVTHTTPMLLRLDVEHLATTADTATYQTAVDQPAAVPFTENGITYTTIAKTGDPDHSAMIGRLISTSVLFHMPALGSEMPDPDALTTIRAWITAP
jgi:hypothetical protein